MVNVRLRNGFVSFMVVLLLGAWEMRHAFAESREDGNKFIFEGAAAVAQRDQGSYKSQLDNVCYREIMDKSSRLKSLLVSSNSDDFRLAVSLSKELLQRCKECFPLAKLNAQDKAIITPLYVLLYSSLGSSLALTGDCESMRSTFEEGKKLLPSAAVSLENAKTIFEGVCSGMRR